MPTTKQKVSVPSEVQDAIDQAYRAARNEDPDEVMNALEDFVSEEVIEEDDEDEELYGDDDDEDDEDGNEEECDDEEEVSQ